MLNKTVNFKIERFKMRPYIEPLTIIVFRSLRQIPVPVFYAFEISNTDLKDTWYIKNARSGYIYAIFKKITSIKTSNVS